MQTLISIYTKKISIYTHYFEDIKLRADFKHSFVRKVILHKQILTPLLSHTLPIALVTSVAGGSHNSSVDVPVESWVLAGIGSIVDSASLVLNRLWSTHARNWTQSDGAAPLRH